MPVKLYSAWYCPFAQRAWMALLYKQIDFDSIEIDPYQQTPWWKETSRGLNLVPVLVVDAEEPGTTSTIVDSSRVLEYLDERYPDIHLFLPHNPEARAEPRFWMDHINQRIVPYIYRFLEANEPGDYREESRVSLIQGIEQLMSVPATDGPYFGGNSINVLDLMLIPFAYRIDALLGHYRRFYLPTQGEVWTRYAQWYDTMLQHDVFIQSQTHGQEFRQRVIEHYLPYTRGEGQKDVTRLT